MRIVPSVQVTEPEASNLRSGLAAGGRLARRLHTDTELFQQRRSDTWRSCLWIPFACEIVAAQFGSVDLRLWQRFNG
ncbi:MAG: hypothetical protein EWM72_02019 [Nitrospira sp.]|nr:MAG: hypothetical protein EWM72_02019 [Nitrospira sp.]